MHQHTQPDDAPDDAAPDVVPADFWEDRYAGADPIWSGRPNATLVDVVGSLGLTAGTALDLGCGEGGDALWLARGGWRVTGLDISPTAVGRARAAADAAGLTAEQAGFEVTDLAHWRDRRTFDLVTASFLHSPVELPRAEILRQAADRVAPGGHLLLIAHAAPPPWAKDHDAHSPRPLTPDEELEQLAPDPAAWDVLIAETRERAATGPDGEAATLEDGVVVLQRR